MALQIEVENKKFDLFKNEFVSGQYISLYEWYGIKEKFQELGKNLKPNYKGDFALSDSLKLEFECIARDDSYINFAKLPFQYSVEYVIKAKISTQNSIACPLIKLKSRENLKLVNKKEFSLKSYANNDQISIKGDNSGEITSSIHLKTPKNKVEKTFKSANDELLKYDMAIRATKSGKPKTNSDQKKILHKITEIRVESSAVPTKSIEVGSVTLVNKFLKVDDGILNQEFEKAKLLESSRVLRKNELLNMKELLCTNISHDQLDK